MARNFKELEEKMSPEARAWAKARAKEMIAAQAAEKLRQMARQAIEEHRRGETEELDPDRL